MECRLFDISAKELDQMKESFAGSKPFSHLIVERLISEQDIVNLLQALSNVEFEEKYSDLFCFLQSADFVSLDDPVLNKIKDLLYSKDFLSVIEKISGKKLGNKVDLHATIYRDTDRLLCHDDQLCGRKVAFILYLTDLEKGDGGTLDLYSTKDFDADKIVKRIVPKAGQFAFFEVSDESFHQVSELVKDKQRIAIAGWYHGN